MHMRVWTSKLGRWPKIFVIVFEFVLAELNICTECQGLFKKQEEIKRYTINNEDDLEIDDNRSEWSGCEERRLRRFKVNIYVGLKAPIINILLLG